MARRVLTTFLAMCMAVSVATNCAAETVWSALVMANNRPEPTPIPAELNKLQGTLKRFFNYNQYQVIGSSRQEIVTGEEDWQAASKFFTLHMKAKQPTTSAYRLNLQLFQQEKLLIETEANLNKKSPLVIRGPLVGDGQLVLLLVVE